MSRIAQVNCCRTLTGGLAGIAAGTLLAFCLSVSPAAAAEDEAAATNRFWLWVAADNLKITAVNAVACALEMRRLRPQGQVQ